MIIIMSVIDFGLIKVLFDYEILLEYTYVQTKNMHFN